MNAGVGVKKEEYRGIDAKDNIELKPNQQGPKFDDAFGDGGMYTDDFGAAGDRMPFREMQMVPAPKDDTRQYTIYQAPEEIVYTPESALKEGIEMVRVLQCEINFYWKCFAKTFFVFRHLASSDGCVYIGCCY